MVTTDTSPAVALEPKARLTGKIIKTTLAGALVDVGQELPGVLHISQLQKDPVNKVEDVVHEGQTVDAPRGRKPKMLHVRAHDRWVIAVDVRLSRTSLALADIAGNQAALETLATPRETPDTLVEELAKRITRLLTAHGAAEQCEGVGLVFPGMVDRRTGRVLHSPTLGWRQCMIAPGSMSASRYSSYFHGPRISTKHCGMIQGVRPAVCAAWTVICA